MTITESRTLALAFIGGIGVQEMIVIGIVGVLLFGKRLPEVGRSLGKTLAEFRSSIHGIQSEIHSAVDTPSNSWSTTEKESDRESDYDAASDDFDEVAIPKFEPPSSEPIEQ